jgi:2-iminobutanoate/2-iminopropanoate deaminase
MTRTIIATPAAPKAIGPYSQGVALDRSSERTLYCSGQIGLDPASGELVKGDVAAQTERALSNLEAVLAAGGFGLADVVKTTVFLADMADFARMNEVYGKRFGAAPPARSTVAVAALPKGARVEVEAVAVRST